MKKKTCKACQERYERLPEHPPFRNWCSDNCAIELVKIKRAKAQANKDKAFRKETKRLRTAMNDNNRGYWLGLCQKQFNRFIRARDFGSLCISCNAVPKNDGYIGSGSVNAGHYKSVGAHPELRFEEINCHNQCARCNKDLSANIVNYRPRLIDKIGIEQVEWLEGPHDPKRYTIEDLKAIKAKYSKLARDLEDANN